MINYYVIAIISGVISAFSQVLLKKASMHSYSSKWREYVNPFVISGYILVVICMLLMIYAYRGIEFKYGAIIESLTYFYVMILSKIIFKEQITMKKLVGNIFIVIGAAVFTF